MNKQKPKFHYFTYEINKYELHSYEIQDNDFSIPKNRCIINLK